MTRRTPTLLIGAAAVASVLLAGGCGVESGRSATGASDTKCPWKADSSITTKARIAYQKIPNADLVVKDQGLLEACMPKAKVTWSNFASGGDVVQAYGADSVDLGLMGSSPAATALSEPLNLPISVVWIHDVIGTAESLVARDESVQDLAGLKGKTIAVPFGSTAHFSLLQALQDAGMDESKDVKLVNLEPEKMPSAWQGGQIDAAWVWDPVQTELKKTGHVVLSSEDTAKAGKSTYDLGTASNAFVKENPAFMEQWAKAQDYATTLITDEPDKAAESIAAELGVSASDAGKLFAGYEYLPAAEQAAQEHLGGQMGKDLFTTAKFLLGQGAIKVVAAPTVYAGGVDASPAQKAAEKAAE
jgi:taurine transport system substrate-binding protein